MTDLAVFALESSLDFEKAEELAMNENLEELWEVGEYKVYVAPTAEEERVGEEAEVTFLDDFDAYDWVKKDYAQERIKAKKARYISSPWEKNRKDSGELQCR